MVLMSLKSLKPFFLKTAKHDAYSGSCGTFACMNFHRRKVTNGIARWIVIAVYVDTGVFLILGYIRICFQGRGVAGSPRRGGSGKENRQSLFSLERGGDFPP